MVFYPIYSAFLCYSSMHCSEYYTFHFIFIYYWAAFASPVVKWDYFFLLAQIALWRVQCVRKINVCVG